MRSASIMGYNNALIEALNNFKCFKDNDVQSFLNTKAIDFERRGWASTYLLLSKNDFKNGNLKIEGYFSLTHKALVFLDNTSNSSRQKITGFKNTTTGSFVLIGQLGKRMERDENNIIKVSTISAEDLLNDAMSVIRNSSEYIVNRNVIVECKNIDKIKNIYTEYGFIDLQYDPRSELHTLYLKLDVGL